jgi:hypothetical protein
MKSLPFWKDNEESLTEGAEKTILSITYNEVDFKELSESHRYIVQEHL